MTSATRSLRWYSGLAVVFFGILPAVLLTLLVIGGNTPRSVGIVLVIGTLIIAFLQNRFAGGRDA